MSFGVGMQNYSSNNLQLSDKDKNLSYKVKDGDTIDGVTASIVNQYGDDDLKNSIAHQYEDMKNPNQKTHTDFNQLSDKDKENALLWFADKQSTKVASDSIGIKDRNVISAGQTLNLNQLLGEPGPHSNGSSTEYGIDGFTGSINLSSINGHYNPQLAKQ